MTAKNFGEVHGGGGADQPGEKTATAIVSGRGVVTLTAANMMAAGTLALAKPSPCRSQRSSD